MNPNKYTYIHIYIYKYICIQKSQKHGKYEGHIIFKYPGHTRTTFRYLFWVVTLGVVTSLRSLEDLHPFSQVSSRKTAGQPSNSLETIFQKRWNKKIGRTKETHVIMMMMMMLMMIMMMVMMMVMMMMVVMVVVMLLVMLMVMLMVILMVMVVMVTTTTTKTSNQAPSKKCT